VHRNHLTQILSKGARFPVEQARAGVKTVPNHLFVIAPNTTLTVEGDVLTQEFETPLKDHTALSIYLTVTCGREGPARSVLSSLEPSPTEQKAFKRSNRQVAPPLRRTRVLLSFFGMPSTAIETGCVDFIVPPADVARELIKTVVVIA
jgi:two-component system, chemotaxis family, CheB/CheR fusion protein